MKEEVNEQVIDVVEHEETIESLTDRIKDVENLLKIKTSIIEEDTAKMKRDISRVDTLIKSHINKKVVEIMVLEEDGKWGDYSGTFSLSSEEEEEITVAKAEKHFETYFQNGFYHQDKDFAIFVLSPIGGKRLIKELDTKNTTNTEVV